MFWGCFSSIRAKTLTPVPGMKYLILENRVVIRTWKTCRITWNRQHCLAYTHSLNKEGWVDHVSRVIKCLGWPENSTDSNSTENLWAIMKTSLRKMDCSTKGRDKDVVSWSISERNMSKSCRFNAYCNWNDY